MPDLAEVRNLPLIQQPSETQVTGSTRTIKDPPHRRHEQFDDPYYNRVMQGCELEAWSSGFSLILSLMSDQINRTSLDTARDIAGKSDSIVILATSLPDDVIEELSKITPVVLIAATQESYTNNVPVISTDNYSGMRLLARHIIKAHNISQLAYIAGHDNSPDNHARYLGFCQALRNEGIIPESIPIYLPM